jgi:hypothetical protein
MPEEFRVLGIDSLDERMLVSNDSNLTIAYAISEMGLQLP